MVGQAGNWSELVGSDVTNADFPRAPLDGGGGRTKGEESDDRHVESPEDLLGPTHLKVDDGAEREGRVGSIGKAGEVVVEVLGRLVAERVGSWIGWARGGCELEDFGEGVLGERGGGGGGNDEGSMVISGDKVVAELRAGLEMATPSS